MALSRYSVLPQQQVLNTYVAPDLRYLAAAGQARQKAYDEGIAFNQAIEDKYNKVKTRDVDVARKNELVNQYTQEAQQIIANNDGDVGRALPTLRKHASTYAANPFWNHAENALKQYTDMQEANKRITEKGGSALIFNNDAAKKAVYNADGTYNTPSYELQTALDYTEPKMKLMNDIAKDTRLSGLSHAAIEGMLQSGKFTGVTGAKVQAVAQQMLLPYLGTDAGRQEVRVLERAGYSDAQIQRKLLSSLVGIGSKQIGSEATVSYDQEPGYALRLRAALKKQAEAGNNVLQDAETGATMNPLAPDKIEYDGEGKPYVAGKHMVPKIMGKDDHVKMVEESYKDYAGVGKQFEELRTNYKRLHPGEKLPSDKELGKVFNQAVENSGLTTIKTENFAPKGAAIASQEILGLNYKKGDISGLQGRQIAILGTKGEMRSKLITLDKALEEMGVKADDAHKITSAQVVGRLKQNPLIPGGYKVTVTAGGKSYELAVSGPKQETDFMSQIQPLVNSAYTGKSSAPAFSERSVKIGSVSFRSIPAPKPDGSGFETQIRAYEQVNGKTIPLRERNPDGTIKKNKQGQVMYAPTRSLDTFTKEYHNMFLQAHGDLFNVAGATGKELDDDPDIDL